MRFSVDREVRRAQRKGRRKRSKGGGGGREKGQNFPASRGLFSKGKAVSDEEAHFSFSLFFPLLLNLSLIILIKNVEAEDS